MAVKYGRERIYRKRITNFLLALEILASVTTCGKHTGTQSGSQAPTWQEQYDLGIRYLFEGNYEEAIFAFTAAIEIDPKQAPAYVGRGNAYVLSGETEESLTAAQADYEQAIEQDETLAEAYLGLSDVYIRQGEYDKALEVLKQEMKKLVIIRISQIKLRRSKTEIFPILLEKQKEKRALTVQVQFNIISTTPMTPKATRILFPPMMGQVL